MGRKRRPMSQVAQEDEPTAPKKSRDTADQKRAGAIHRIILKNFMCHKCLDVQFDSNISVVIGRNGSGKSAILTALVIGLGGKASLTNRGTSVKGFVKAGTNSGSVEIQLCNEGPMAYRPAVYGDRITVKRSFTASGGSSYSIKAASGQVVATQVKELQNITTSLNIQVDNPICILNQDVSRNFLSTNDPKHKFSLFMKATKLEMLAQEYETIKINKREALRLWSDKHQSFKGLQDELKSLKRKIDIHKSIVGIRDKLKQSQLELLWAKVRDFEEELAQVNAKVDHYERKYETVLNDCALRNDRIDKIKDNIKALEQQIMELKQTIQVQSRPQLDVRNIIEDLRTKYNNKRREKQLIMGTMESKRRDVHMLETEIASVNQNMSRVEQEKIERMRKLSRMSEKIKNMEDHLQTCRNDLYQINSDVSHKEDEKQELKREMIRIDSQINHERASLNALKNESGNTLLLYGRDIPRVKQMIEQYKSRFSQVPRGPLGHYIKLRDKKWAIAVESHLGPALLGSFTVDNKRDNLLLMEIFNQVWSSGRKPTIITSRFFNKKHDIGDNLVEAPQDCVSIYEAVEIDDPVVANCIVDQMSIENILLIPSNNRAMELLSSAARVPRNCHQGITITGDKYYPEPNYRTYGSRYHRAAFLQVDTKEHILQLQQNIEELMRKKDGLQMQFNLLNREIEGQDANKAELELKIKKLNVARSQIRKQLEELQASAEPEVANVDLLESELKEVRKILNEKQTELGRVDEALKEMKSAIVENEEKLNQLKDSNSSLEERMQSLEAQIQEETIKQKEIATSDVFDRKRVREIEEKLDEVRAAQVSKKATVDQYTEQAASVGARLEILRTVPDIMGEIAQLERSVKRIATDTENVGEVLERYQEMYAKFNVVSNIMDTLNDDIKELSLAVDKRNRHYKLTQDWFLSFIKHAFKKFMQMRQFQGSIDINVADKKVELNVIPQHGSQGLTTTANLSGGERSFSTVAFLYSLWQCMEFPFYFLDEFDVYMDKLNRSKVFEILIQHAETHPELQFVFLTPQDISFLKPNVTLLKLSDPERNAA